MPGYAWTENADEHNNTVCELLAPYEDVEAYFRIRQRLSGNKIEYYDDSTPEYFDNGGEWWLDIEHAKASLEECYDRILHIWDPED